MPGQLVPLVLIPRYTTFAGLPSDSVPPTIGVAYFSTIAMDVTQYSSAMMSVWRGKLIGTVAPVVFTFQESMDQVHWTDLATGADPGENVETETTFDLTKRWFRVTVEFGNADNVCSCYAVGFLVERVS